MPTHVLVNGLGLTHKGSVGLSTATIPDVCKTPSPAGPVPIPYPNIADCSTLSGGTTTVFVKGNMIANKGSEYSTSSGDEPGTAGGVTSSTFKKETAWILYSFDVKMDGQNACRHTDQKFHNHKNTVDMGGNIDPCPNLSAVKCAIHQCDNEEHDLKGVPKDKRCQVLGTKKHDCVAKKMKDKEPEIYSETFVDMTPKPPKPPVILTKDGKGIHNFFQAANTIGNVATYKQESLRRPDIIMKDKYGKYKVVDAKFPCPDDIKSGKDVRPSPDNGESMLTGEQQRAYKRIQGDGKEPNEIQPSDCSSKDCGGK